MKHKVDWIALLIFLIALIPRLTNLNLIEFKADESLTVLDLHAFIQKPHLISSGLISSTGARNFPLFEYLLIIPALISQDPRVISGLIGMVNALMIIWFYWITKREYGQPTAAIASILFATSPWSILFSRKIWAQDLIPLFAVPLYDLIHRYKANKKPFYLVMIGILMILQAQLHASGIFFFMLSLVVLWVNRPIRFRYLFIGWLIGCLPALPYIGYECSTQPFCPDCRAVFNNPNHLFEIKHFIEPFIFIGGFDWQQVMGEQDFRTFQAIAPFSVFALIAFTLEMAVTMWGAVSLATRRLHPSWLLVFLGLPCLYLLFQVPARLHYYQVIAPWLMLIAGLGIESFMTTQKELVWTTLGLIGLLNLGFIATFFNYLIDKNGVTGDYGCPYQISVTRVDTLTASYQARPDFVSLRAHAFFAATTGGLDYQVAAHLSLADYFYSIHDYHTALKELYDARVIDSHNTMIQQAITTIEQLE